MASDPRILVFIAAVLAQPLSACGPDAPTQLEWPDLSSDEVSMVVLLEAGRVLAQHGPFTRAQEDLSVVKELYRDTQTLLHLSFDPREVAARVPGFTLERTAQLRVGLGGGCPVTRLEDGTRSVSLETIRARARRLEGEQFGETTAPPNGLVLLVPPDDGGCFPGEAASLSPFGAEEFLLPNGSVLNGVVLEPGDNRANLEHGEPAGPDHVFAWSLGLLFMFERGAAWQDDPRHYWAPSNLPSLPGGGGWAITTATRDPFRSSSTDSRIVFGARWQDQQNNTLRSIVAEVHWTAEGFGAVRVLHEMPEPASRAVFFRPDGRLVVVGEDALLLVSNGGPEDPAERLTNVGLEGTLRAVTIGPSEAEPLAVLESRSRLFFGRGEPETRFRRENVDALEFGAYSLAGVRLEQGEMLYLLDSEDGEVSTRRPDGSRGVFEFDVPLDFVACSSPPDACGNLGFSGDRTAMTSTSRGTILLAPGACSGVLDVDPNNGCSRGLSMADRAPSDEERSYQNSVHDADGVVTIAGVRGRLVQSR